MGNMGLSMAGNLVKNGFEVKGFDLSEKTLEKASTMVSISFLNFDLDDCGLGYHSSDISQRRLLGCKLCSLLSPNDSTCRGSALSRRRYF